MDNFYHTLRYYLITYRNTIPCINALDLRILFISYYVFNAIKYFTIISSTATLCLFEVYLVNLKQKVIKLFIRCIVII
jgi:hypothetical protein